MVTVEVDLLMAMEARVVVGFVLCLWLTPRWARLWEAMLTHYYRLWIALRIMRQGAAKGSSTIG